MKELLMLLQGRNRTIGIAFLSVLLLLTIAWISKINIPYTKITGLVFFGCLINGVFFVLIRQTLWLKMTKHIQPVVNVLLITIGIHYTGGIESIFIYLYLMMITGESIRMEIKRGYLFAAFSLFCYGGVIGLEMAGIIPHIHTSDFFAEDAFKNIPFFILVCTTISAFLIAFLSGYLSMIVRDIIKMKDEELLLAAQKIVATTNLLQAVLDNMSEGVISVDANQMILSTNTVINDLLNIQKGAVINKSLSQIFSETPLISAVEQALKKEKTSFCQIDILSKEKDVKSFLTKITPLKDKDNSFSGVVIVFQDISTEKRFSTIKATLLSILSHELRTPLTSIKAYTEMLLEEETEGKKKEFLQVVSNESDRLNELIENFISFAKLELKAFNLKKEPVNVPELIDELIKGKAQRHMKTQSLTEIERLAQEKNILLSYEAIDEEITTLGDHAHIKKAIGHIITNAIKFTPQNGRITISVKPVSGIVEIRISDTGIGIDPANHRRIFEPFYQVDLSATRSTGGMGMGLAVTKGIIDALGGEISVESRLGKGSTFVISLPLTEK